MPAALKYRTDRKDARGPTDAALLVPARALQIRNSAGRVLPVDGAQAGSIEALRCGNALRGILRGFGLKVGPITSRRPSGRIRELVSSHATLETVAESLLAVSISGVAGVMPLVTGLVGNPHVCRTGTSVFHYSATITDHVLTEAAAPFDFRVDFRVPQPSAG